jgi:hypothetical protein
MPLPQHIRQELELKRVTEHQLAERDAFRARVRTAIMCVVWSAVGLFIMGWGLHTTDPDLGQVAWLGGMVVGYSGILFTLARAYLKARERGDVMM